MLTCKYPAPAVNGEALRVRGGGASAATRGPGTVAPADKEDPPGYNSRAAKRVPGHSRPTWRHARSRNTRLGRPVRGRP